MSAESSDTLLESLFEKAFSLGSEELPRFLEEVRQQHPDLVVELEDLLQAHQSSGSFLTEEPVSEGPDQTPRIPSQLGHYRMEQKIGEGGMGEVYRAVDTRLNREVAVKFLYLRPHADQPSKDRLNHEAKLLASVNHPSVASVYGLEEADTVCGIVMEYVPGDGLDKRLKQSRLAPLEALRIALGVARALEAVHERGLIHLDLKPSNVKVNARGEAKVLDFGLARFMGEDPPATVSRISAPVSSGEALNEALEGEVTDQAPTPDPQLFKSRAALMVGTLPYMSPEQAEGRVVDRRADVWSFGCLLFEMLSGKPLFVGKDPKETHAHVLAKEIDWSLLPEGLPMAVWLLLRKCLRREVDRRLSDMGSARLDLEETIKDLEQAADHPESTYPWQGVSRRRTGSMLVASVSALCLGAWIAWFGKPQPTLPDVPLPQLVKLPLYLTRSQNASQPGDRIHFLSMSPNGKNLVFRDAYGLWNQPLDRLASPVLLTRSRTQESFWAPDNTMVAYLEGNKLYGHPVDGGARFYICQVPGDHLPNHGGGAWREDGTLLFNTGDLGLFEVAWPLQAGEAPQLKLGVSEKDDNFHQASALPGGKGVVFVNHRRHKTVDTLSLWTEATGKRDLLTLPGQDLAHPVFCSSGHILFSIARSDMQGIWAFPFNANTLQRTGDMFQVTQSHGSGLSVSRDRNLVYAASESERGEVRMTLLSSTGLLNQNVEGNLFRESIGGFQISPDQKRLLFQVSDPLGGDVWMHQFASGASSRITRMGDVHEKWAPLWLDNEQFVFNRWGEQGVSAWKGSLNAGGEDAFLSDGLAVALSRTGRYLIIQGMPRWGQHTLMDFSQAPPSANEFPAHLSDAWSPKISHDDTLMAFVSGEQQRDDYVYVTEFPSFEKRYIVNPQTRGTHPFWHPSKRILFFVDSQAGKLMSVTFDSGDVSFSEPKELLTLPSNAVMGDMHQPYTLDLLENEQENQFVMLEGNLPSQKPNAALTPDAILVQNWYLEFLSRSQEAE